MNPLSTQTDCVPSLRANALTVLSVLTQGVTHIAPTFGLVLLLRFVAAIAGLATPLAFVIAFLIMLMLGDCLVQLAGHLPSAGGYYTYVSYTLHFRDGFRTAWMYCLYDPLTDAVSLARMGFLLHGIPNRAGLGVKMAEHMGGIYAQEADSVIQPPDARDLDPIRATASKILPDLVGTYPGTSARLLLSVTCPYTITRDEHFIVDHHPLFRNIVFAAVFFGRAFKFAPLIAVALADLVQDGTTSFPLGFLSLHRFAHPRHSLSKKVSRDV